MSDLRPSKRLRLDIDSSLPPLQADAASSVSEDSRSLSTDGSSPDNDLVYIGLDMRGRWVGPMSPQAFLDEFLPRAGSPRPTFKEKNDFHAMATAEDECKMRHLFISAMTPFAPTLKFFITRTNKTTGKDKITVDLEVNAYRSDTGEQFTTNDFSQMEIPLVFKGNAEEDPFVDSDGSDEGKKKCCPLEKNNTKAIQILGQIASCPSALAAAQFRIHSFSVLVCGQWARLFRWDRNGTLVTERFRYAKADYFVEFFWRYSQLPHDDPQRGHDPTVRPLPGDHQVSQEEEGARVTLMEVNPGVHREFRIMLIPDRETNEEFEFLISYPPRYTRHLPVGRATRPMLAFDLLKKKLVFAKDYWRTDDGQSDKEGYIYKVLQEKNVPHIATFWKGNDVRAHLTVTDSKRALPWARRSIKMDPLRHYRMSLEEVGRPLRTFTSTHELVTAIADAMEAHEYARHDAEILHRDISSGNIIITEHGHGLLIDWDLSLNLNNEQAAMKDKRVGTLEFESIANLDDPKRRQDHFDDRESAFHVLVWSLLRYTKHDKIPELVDLVKMFHEVLPSGATGSAGKTYFMGRGVHRMHFDNPILDDLVKDLARVFDIRYQIDPSSAAWIAFCSSERAHSDWPGNPLVRLRRFEDRWWLVNTLRESLKDRSKWPKKDAACLNPDRIVKKYKYEEESHEADSDEEREEYP